MHSEVQAKALEKIKRARKQFFCQQHLKMQFEEKLKKLDKPRESLVKKGNKGKQYDAGVLWERLQGLPIYQHLIMERQFGLNKVLPSQRQQKFQESLFPDQ